MKKSEKTVESGPVAGTSLIGSKYMHGKRNTDGTPPTAIPFKFVQADTREGLLALIESSKYGVQWVIDRFNYGSTLKEQAAVTPSASGSGSKAQRDRARDHLEDHYRQELELVRDNPNLDPTEHPYRSMYADYRSVIGTARDKWLDDYAKEEGVL